VCWPCLLRCPLLLLSAVSSPHPLSSIKAAAVVLVCPGAVVLRKLLEQHATQPCPGKDCACKGLWFKPVTLRTEASSRGETEGQAVG